MARNPVQFQKGISFNEFLSLVFDSEEFKLIVKQWVSGHTKSLGTTYRRSSQFE